MNPKTQKSDNPKTPRSELVNLAAGRGRTKTEQRGRGRPPRTDNPKTLTVKIPGDLKQELQHQAINEGRDMSAIITELVRVYLREKSGR